MSKPALKPLHRTGMTVDEFHAWEGDGSGRKLQLIDGIPVATARPIHGIIQANITHLIVAHLNAQGSRCRVATKAPVVPRVSADRNERVSDLAVTCTPEAPDERSLPDPVLAVEILSPGNEAETRESVRAYTTIPSMNEILIVHSSSLAAKLFRRMPDVTYRGPSCPIFLPQRTC